jgi:fructosamine-3-kinase
MHPFPEDIRQVIEQNFAAKITAIHGVGGGCIANACGVSLDNHRKLFVKHLPQKHEGGFAEEANSLTLLKQYSTTVQTPEVLLYRDEPAPAYLVLSWIEVGPKTRAANEQMGLGLAELHRHLGPSYGVEDKDILTALRAWYAPKDNWVDFFGQSNLLDVQQLLIQKGLWNRWREQHFQSVIQRLPNLIPRDPGPSLLHGDLWGGNWVATVDDTPYFIDPRPYFGHREAELAFTELFGGFGPDFYAAYHATFALDPGYPDRRDLYNLFPLMRHLWRFGEDYGPAVDAVLQRYGA